MHAGPGAVTARARHRDGARLTPFAGALEEGERPAVARVKTRQAQETSGLGRSRASSGASCSCFPFRSGAGVLVYRGCRKKVPQSGGLNDRNVGSPSSGGGKSKAKVLAGPSSRRRDEERLPWLPEVCWPSRPSLGSWKHRPILSRPSACLSPRLPFYKDILDQGLPSRSHLNTVIYKNPISKSHVHRCLSVSVRVLPTGLP